MVVWSGQRAFWLCPDSYFSALPGSSQGWPWATALADVVCLRIAWSSTCAQVYSRNPGMAPQSSCALRGSFRACPVSGIWIRPCRQALSRQLTSSINPGALPRTQPRCGGTPVKWAVKNGPRYEPDTCACPNAGQGTGHDVPSRSIDRAARTALSPCSSPDRGLHVSISSRGSNE